jgi:hypothetical protein
MTFKTANQLLQLITARYLRTEIIFLTNAILATKGISNGIVGVITSVNTNNKVEAAFPTKNGIKVRASNITLL